VAQGLVLTILHAGPGSYVEVDGVKASPGVCPRFLAPLVPSPPITWHSRAFDITAYSHTPQIDLFLIVAYPPASWVISNKQAMKEAHVIRDLVLGVLGMGCHNTWTEEQKGKIHDGFVALCKCQI
jgi:hypothetical protein